MSMKKFLSVLFVFMLVSYLSTVALAQANGIGHAQGHAPDVSRDHGPNHDKNIGHDSNHAGTARATDEQLEARMDRTMTKISVTIATMREPHPKKTRGSKHASSEILG